MEYDTLMNGGHILPPPSLQNEGEELKFPSIILPPLPPIKHIYTFGQVHKLFIGRGCVDIIGNYYLSVLSPPGDVQLKEVSPRT